MSSAPRASHLAACAAMLGIISGCSPRPAEEAAVETPTAIPTVEILAPATGDTIALPFTLRVAASGLTIAPASGVREEGIGHHHLLIDLDPTPDGEPIPAAPGYVHLGSGVSEFVLDSLPAGEHRIIAILAWGDHVPIEGSRRDTVRFVVR